MINTEGKTSKRDKIQTFALRIWASAPLSLLPPAGSQLPNARSLRASTAASSLGTQAPADPAQLCGARSTAMLLLNTAMFSKVML